MRDADLMACWIACPPDGTAYDSNRNTAASNTIIRKCCQACDVDHGVNVNVAVGPVRNLGSAQ